MPANSCAHPEEEEVAATEHDDVGDAGITDLQAELQAILDSLLSEVTTEAEHRCIHDVEMEHTTDGVKVCVAMDDDDVESGPSYEPIYPVLDTNVMDISDAEA
ncbi:hypothetical protein ZWY2020_041522 [Hordeum vulgare]|nr:hypothetical protein ZWY2020_041522 [Hordeum vulgare]